MAGKAKAEKVKVTLLVNTIGAKAFDVIECDPEVAADMVANHQGYVTNQPAEG
jgi:hypothetical protein